MHIMQLICNPLAAESRFQVSSEIPYRFGRPVKSLILVMNDLRPEQLLAKAAWWLHADVES